MPTDTSCPDRRVVPTRTTDDPVDGVEDGWQILAEASLGRLLTEVERAAVRHRPAEFALDLLFPDLDDAARHEALCALG